MKNFRHFFFFVLVLFSACVSRSHQATENSTKGKPINQNKYYFKEVSNAIKSSMVCQGKVMPLHYSIYETDYAQLRKLLLRKSSSPGAINLDTTILIVPVPGGTFEEFAITQVQVLPPELSEKYPEIKTFQGKSVVFPEDNIRLDIAPKGISYMIMSTRGTIMMDPFCIDDSIHVITYFKKDLPEGVKEDFEK